MVYSLSLEQSVVAYDLSILDCVFACYCAKETESLNQFQFSHSPGTPGDPDDGQSSRGGSCAGELILPLWFSFQYCWCCTQCPLSPDPLWLSSILSCLSLTLLSVTLPCCHLIFVLHFNSPPDSSVLSPLPSPPLTHSHTHTQYFVQAI